MNPFAPLNRRRFLRAAGVSIGLPLFESLLPRTARAANAPPIRRLVAIGNPFGMYPEGFFPKQAGLEGELPDLLVPLAEHRKQFTVFSHLDHGVTGGHRGVQAFLSGVKAGDARGMPEGNITLDQRAAEHVGARTRFAVLNTGVGGGCEMSWTRASVMVPPITQARELFRALFVDKTADERRKSERRYDVETSILDAVGEHARSLNARLGKSDQQKLEEYLTSIRDVEQRIDLSRTWLDRPKPKTTLKEPTEDEFVESLPVFFDLLALALEADATRVATLEIPHGFNTSDLGLAKSYHALSHHGKAEDNVAGLVAIERFQMQELARFLERLRSLKGSEGQPLLDNTVVLFGSGMGNGSSHSNTNLPVLVAGGGLRHKGHVQLPTEESKRVPLCNLYLSLLQWFGLQIDRFGLSKGTLAAL